MIILKNLIRRIIIIFTRILSKTKIGRYANEIIINDLMSREKTVIHNNIKMKFLIPNILNNYRIKTFSEKEPETLNWIDSLPKDSILWDIGANIGLYSIYAAIKKNCKVIAFEPSVFNLELLARNIFINNLIDRISIIPLALSNKMGFSKMQMTTTDWGGALSTFGEDFGWDGQPIKDIFSYQTFGIKIDSIIELMNLQRPDYIKMDVDGVEHIILEGGKDTLTNIKGLLIEINDDFSQQANQSKVLLEESGLVIESKLHSDLIKNSKTGFANSYNQIWVRKNDK